MFHDILYRGANPSGEIILYVLQDQFLGKCPLTLALYIALASGRFLTVKQHGIIRLIRYMVRSRNLFAERRRVEHRINRTSKPQPFASKPTRIIHQGWRMDR